MKIEDVTKANVFKLVGAYLRGAKQLASLEKEFVGQEVKARAKTLSVAAVLAIAGLVLLALGGLVLLVTVILALTLWFSPWLAALIVTIALMVLGGVLVLIGMLQAKKDVDKTKATLDQVGKDIRWLRQR